MITAAARNHHGRQGKAEAEDRAARMAHNLRVIREAEAAAAKGPAPDGEGYGFEELAEAEVGRAVHGEPTSDAFSFDELAEV